MIGTIYPGNGAWREDRVVEQPFPVCERCGCDLDPNAAYCSRWTGGWWEPCDPCNGWEDWE